MTEFYPNSCFICQVTKKLKRCSRCNMISYCGKEHQLEHWSKHKEFCNKIAEIMKEQGISHLYENLQGLDSQSWKLQAELLIDEVEKRLARDVNFNEFESLIFPRVCFVCHEARQELLRNCPGCPAASFCNNHLNCPLHNEDCHKIKKIHDIKIESDSTKQTMLLETIMPIINSVQIDESSKLPDSMEGFLDEYAKRKMDFSKNELIILSDNCNEQLTIFNALRKLDYSLSEIIVHIEGMSSSIETTDTISFWEVLFHLLPHLRNINIVLVEVDFARKVEIIPCESCISNKKKLFIEWNTLPYLEYIKTKDYKKPDILVFLNVHPEILDSFLISWQMKVARCHELNCPLILTTNIEAESIKLRKVLRSTLGKYHTCYEGINKFGSLAYFRHWDVGICLPNHFLLIIHPAKDQKFSLDSFYAGHCAVCFSEEATVSCKNCRMVFYCGQSHRNKHLPQHQNICDVISKMLRDSGGSSLFDKLIATDQESLLKIKIDLILKAKMKLGRDLLHFEKEMFLYPKICFVCHESNLELLRTCECGVSFCEDHERDQKHIQLCQDFSLAFQLSTISEPPSLQGIINADLGMAMPSSMDDFISSFYKFKDEHTQQSIFHLQKIILSNLLTRPLTFASAVKKLNLMIDSLMVVHVIGATGMEVGTYAYWMPIFFLLERLHILNIIFIGPNVFSANYYLDTFFSESNCAVIDEDILKVECHALRYEEYYQSDSFIYPDIIVGYNLNIHESEFGISECTWKDTVLTLKKINAPFILTAGTEDRARRDHKRLCEILDKTFDYLYLEQNPFSGWIPERDFETEELLYANQYVIAYDALYEKREENIENKSSNVENP